MRRLTNFLSRIWRNNDRNISLSIYQYGDMRRLATLNYNIETSTSLSIVSSIEFDKDGEYFVIAGVTKRIKLYDYNAVVESDARTHYPLEQLACNAKISNVSWNPYTKSLLASSDYEGTVQLWWGASINKRRNFEYVSLLL